MATLYIPKKTCDIDGRDADSERNPVKITVDGAGYEIDLCDGHIAELVTGPLTDHARRRRGGGGKRKAARSQAVGNGRMPIPPATGNGGPPELPRPRNRETEGAAREWFRTPAGRAAAAERRIHVADKGRLSRAAQQLYDDAHR